MLSYCQSNVSAVPKIFSFLTIGGIYISNGWQIGGIYNPGGWKIGGIYPISAEFTIVRNLGRESGGAPHRHQFCNADNHLYICSWLCILSVLRAEFKSVKIKKDFTDAKKNSPAKFASPVYLLSKPGWQGMRQEVRRRHNRNNPVWGQRAPHVSSHGARKNAFS